MVKRGGAAKPRVRRGTRARAFEGLPVAATVTDGRGRIVAVNREARRLAGPLPRAGEVLTCREYWGCHLPSAHCPLRRAVRTGRTVRHALVRAVGAHGPITLVERVSPLRLPGGGRGAVLVTGPATSFFRRIRRLRDAAHLDALTTLLNRRRFDELTRRALFEDRRRGRGAFVMADVDGLKKVNDRFGHAAGDRHLRRLGRILSAGMRHGDVVGRVGGDEFAAYCPDTSPAQARELVRRLRRAIAADNTVNPRLPPLSASFGLAFSRPGRNEDLRERADASLRAQKLRVHAGR